MNSRRQIVFSPQAWGWTEFGQNSNWVQTFSPQAWGWTVQNVYRDSRPRRFPHRRGGGPVCGGFWGSCRCVFPTGVGVDRYGLRRRITRARFPHRRGGGPPLWGNGDSKVEFSPQAWGWTSGNGSSNISPAFSPQAWGWTDDPPVSERFMEVFPTGVGVDRDNVAWPEMAMMFSPQAWGWTDILPFDFEVFIVFPTGVGVDRGNCFRENNQARFPHRRGGGPFWELRDYMAKTFSPQAWGWTGYELRFSVDRASFPHRRGGGPL